MDMYFQFCKRKLSIFFGCDQYNFSKLLFHFNEHPTLAHRCSNYDVENRVNIWIQLVI